MNGYFRVVPTNASTDLTIYAPTDGGSAVPAYIISEYLIGKAISFDNGELVRAVEQSTKADVTVTLNRVPINPLNASIGISIAKDLMSASIIMYAGSPNGGNLSASDIMSDLALKGIKKGIDEALVNELANSPRYCEEIEIAKGTMPEAGKDGYIEYLFNTDNSTKPTLLEDGSVDFFHLNVLNSCGKGQVIAKLHKPVKGEDGFTVDGKVIPSRVPDAVAFKFGNNAYVSEDGLELKSSVDGSVSLVAGQVFVHNEISFEGIGPATGNIEFEGNVSVSGNVDTNFSIKAKGDVIVNGVVEGAEIEAGGNIIIAKGVNGMGRAVLNAGGNIIAKYMENVTATAGGYISSEAIMHSTVSAVGDIIVDGRKGMLSGGKATSGGVIEVKTLGAQMANDTIVEVGITPAIKREIQNLRNEVAEKQKTLASITPVMSNLAMKIKSGATLTNEQKVYVAKLMQTQKTTTEELETLSAKLMDLENKYNIDTASEVRVKGVAYPGTRVCISDVSMAVKTPTKYCKFVRLRGDVKIVAYE